MPEQQRSRHAVVVRGGWEGHSPVEATDRFIPFLEDNGFEVEVHDGPQVYDDTERLARADLVLQCFTQGEATDAQVTNSPTPSAPGRGWPAGTGGSSTRSAGRRTTST